jgi:hypothetical protein
MTETEQFLSKPWQKFLLKLKDVDALETHLWKSCHHLGYIMKRYEKTFQQNFALSFKNSHTKCPEMIVVGRIFASLSTTNNETIKEYIDWVYENKIIPKKIKFRTLGFFLTPGFANEFSSYWKEKNKIQKSTPIPIHWKQVVDVLKVSAETYGDLAFIKLALNQDQSREPYCKLFKSLQAMGFDEKILNTLV